MTKCSDANNEDNCSEMRNQCKWNATTKKCGDISESVSPTLIALLILGIIIVIILALWASGVFESNNSVRASNIYASQVAGRFKKFFK